MPKVPKRKIQEHNNQQITEVPQQVPQPVNPFNSIDPIQQYTQPTSQELVPDERYFQYSYDQFGTLIVDNMGPVVIDTRNGRRVHPVDQYGNFMPFPIPYFYQQVQSMIMQTQSQQLPPGTTTTSRIIRDTGSDINGDAFLLDEDFFLEESEKAKFPKGDDIMNYYNNQYAPQMNSVISSSVKTSTIKNINDLPIKIRYSEKDFDDFFMTSDMLAKRLLDEAIKNHPEIRYSIVPNAYGFQEMSIFKNGILIGKFIIELESWGGKGLPIMHGIVGNQFSDNHIIVPLGATKAVEECIMAIAYNTGGGVYAVTQAKYEQELLPVHIYATVDFGVTAFPDGLDKYKKFGEQIERIDKYYELKTRYRLYGYKDNFNFTLISDEFVKPFGQKAPILHESIVVENNSLTIKQPNGNIKVVQMGV